METLPDWNSLQSLTGSIPRSAPGYSTNLYGNRDQFEHWCAAGEVCALTTYGAVLVVRADQDFHRVYHVAQGMSALTGALALLPAGQYVTDLVGQGKDLDPLCAAYAASGFGHYAFLRRMNRPQIASMLPADNVVTATSEDAVAVATFLDRLLDRFSEQLPRIGELRAAACDGRLLLVRQGDAIAGMLMYDIQGQLAHLRFWHVDPSVQGMGVGRRLMGSFLTQCANVRRIVLWVIGDNDRSIAIYRHYGFEADGLLDHIMVANRN